MDFYQTHSKIRLRQESTLNVGENLNSKFWTQMKSGMEKEHMVKTLFVFTHDVLPYILGQVQSDLCCPELSLKMLVFDS